MVEVVLILAVIAAFGIFVLHRSQAPSSERRNALRRAWGDAARLLGLTLEQASGSIAFVVKGELDGMPVRATIPEPDMSTVSSSMPRIEVGCAGDFPPDVKLSPDGVWGLVRKTVGERDVEIGDPNFDAHVIVNGDEVTVAALLGEGARNLARGVIGTLGARVEESQVLYRDTGLLADSGSIVNVIGAMAEAARRLTLGGRAPQACLLHNAVSDSVPGVREYSLSLLTHHFEGSREAKLAVERCLVDKTPSVRLIAAQNAGEAGIPTLEKLAGSGAFDAQVRVRALTHLAGVLSVARLVPLVERLMSSVHDDVRRVAIEHVGRVQLYPLLKRVAAIAESEDEEIAVVAVAALGQLGGGAAHRELIALLERDSAVVRAAVAEVLGEMGTIEAVEPLLPFTEGLLVDDELKDAARAAVAAIQARLGDVEAGQLSLSEGADGAGALSVTGDAGSVSLVEDSEEPHSV